jgi:hypothetical protein
LYIFGIFGIFWKF